MLLREAEPLLRDPELRALERRVPEPLEPVLREPVVREPLPRELPELRELELRDEPRELPELRDELERERVPPLERPLVRPLVRELLDERRVVVRRRLRVVLARWPRGTSARTTSFTRRASSASRNFAIRSSSRLIPFASCAVSLSPTASANVWMRE